MKQSSKGQLSETISAKIAKLSISQEEKIILQEVFAEPIAYISDDRFTKPTVMKPVMDERVEVLPGESLKAGEEEILFLQLNYARHKLCQRRRKLLRQGKWLKKDVLPVFMWHQVQLDCRSKIVTSNMGLVLSMVQRVSYPGVEFADLVSEGSMALLRATEKFDCSKGFKFSTYACRAIFKGFSRAAKQNYRYRSLFPTQLDTALEKDDKHERVREELNDDLGSEMQLILDSNLAQLTDVEISVMKMRYPLNEEKQEPLTLKQVGEKLSLTKERIRQIQNKALSKLKSVAEERLVMA